MSARELVRNAALSALSLAALFAVLELGVRLLVDFGSQQPIAVHDVDWDQPLRFLPGSRSTYQTSEFDVTMAFNRYGRRDAEWSEETVADPRGILVIGDSFVLGNAVEEQETIPARIEASLAERGDAREVLNFGIPGRGPPEYARLLELALREGFGARAVVVGLFVGNDFDPIVYEPQVRPAADPPPAPAGSALLRWLRMRAGQSTRAVGLALTLGRWLGLSLYDSGGSYVFLREQTPEQRELFARVLAEVARMQELATAHGRRLYVVLIPNRLQVENGEELTGRIYDAAAPDSRILAWCRERGLPCLDLLPPLAAEFARGGGPLYYPIDRHFTPRGYALAADRILEFLEAQGALGAVTPRPAAATDVRGGAPERGPDAAGLR